MTLRARLGVSAMFVLAVLVIAGVLLPRTVRAAQIAALDGQFRSALPFAIRLAEGRAPPLPPTATALSELYIAQVESGRQTTVVAPAAAAGRQPQLPRALNQPGRVPSLVTVRSVEGSGSWMSTETQRASPSTDHVVPREAKIATPGPTSLVSEPKVTRAVPSST